MKKLMIFCLSLVTIFFISFGFGGFVASAYTFNPNVPGLDFTPHKNEIVFAEVPFGEQSEKYLNFIMWLGGSEVYVSIEELDYDYTNISFQFNINTDFSPLIESEIRGAGGIWSGKFLRDVYGVDGMYWNPWLQIWQLEYPVDPEEEEEFTYDEAYRKGFIDGQKSVLDAYNERFYFGMDKWLVPAIITVIVLGGIVTIAVRKRRDE